jgi:hypothetical protein
VIASAAKPTLPDRWWWPLLFFQGYLGLTVWLFFYGPWPWTVDNPGTVFAFLAAAQVAVLVGYAASRHQVQRAVRDASTLESEVLIGVRFLKTSLVLSLLMAIPSSLSRTGTWWPDVTGGLFNAGLAYNENFERLDAGNAFVAFEYVRMVLSPWLTAVFPLTVLYWSRLDVTWRIVALASIAFTLGLYLATGTNKGIADVVVTLPWLILLAMGAGLLRIRAARTKVAAASVALLGVFLIFFSQGQQSREGSGVEYGTFFTGVAVLMADSDHFISSLLPEQLRVVFEAISRYVVQGYYALSMALQTDAPSTWGFGHSMFLARNADAVLGTDRFVWQSLPGLLERNEDWGMFQLWHSIYPWLASDVGWPGAIVLIGIFAYLLGLAWGRALVSGSALWTVLLYLLLVLFYYVPANNQVFQSGETLFAFFLVLAMLWHSGRQSRRGTGGTT